MFVFLLFAVITNASSRFSSYRYDHSGPLIEEIGDNDPLQEPSLEFSSTPPPYKRQTGALIEEIDDNEILQGPSPNYVSPPLYFSQAPNDLKGPTIETTVEKPVRKNTFAVLIEREGVSVQEIEEYMNIHPTWREEKEPIGGSNFLHAAVWWNKEEIVKKLIDSNANVNQPNDYGVTPLMFACDVEHKNIAGMLMEAGAYIHMKDEHGKSMLTFAMKDENIQLIRYLVENGCKVEYEEEILKPWKYQLLQEIVTDMKI